MRSGWCRRASVQAVLVAGLVLFGRDGKMLSYAALVLASASCQGPCSAAGALIVLDVRPGVRPLG
jgi:hypothetical protein